MASADGPGALQSAGTGAAGGASHAGPPGAAVHELAQEGVHGVVVGRPGPEHGPGQVVRRRPGGLGAGSGGGSPDIPVGVGVLVHVHELLDLPVVFLRKENDQNKAQPGGGRWSYLVTALSGGHDVVSAWY